MSILYDATVDTSAVITNIKRLTNQTYKLLPNREEGLDWKASLQSIIEEVTGFFILSEAHSVPLFSLLCRLQGLITLEEEEYFPLFRRTIFECLNLFNALKEGVLNESR